MKRRAFTVIEIVVVVLIVGMVSGVVYKLISGTFSQTFKSQSKLTNLRAASIILERFKADIRLAVIPNEEEEPVFNEDGDGIAFHITIKEGDQMVTQMVTYTYNEEDGFIRRTLANGNPRIISRVKVAAFVITEEIDSDSSSKFISVSIIVDDDKDLENRTAVNRGNKIELKAVLYPRFYDESLSEEERYWHSARN